MEKDVFILKSILYLITLITIYLIYNLYISHEKETLLINKGMEECVVYTNMKGRKINFEKIYVSNCEKVLKEINNNK